MIGSMEPTTEDLDVHAYCRSLALQQIRMLTRFTEILPLVAPASGTAAG